MSILTSVLAVGVLLALYGVLYLYRRRGDALLDMVTGLPSRAYFERYLQHAATRSGRNPSYRFGVLLLHIQGFPELRRARGRFTADEILADFAQRVYALIRPSDVFSRLEDDNFAILLEDVRESVDVPRVAIRVHNSLKEVVTLAAVELAVAARIGVTISNPGVTQDAGVILEQAQTALHRAIDTDRPFAVFDQEIERSAARDMQLESELREAITRNELTLGFQPFVDSRTRILKGFTALVRWTHPRRGLLQAREFIEVAESSGQMLHIGEWVIGEGIRAIEAINAAAGHPLVLTINVGVTELERGKLVERLTQTIAEHPALAGWLRIELAAEMLITKAALVAATNTRMRELSIGLHLDHAGGGLPVWQAIRLNPSGIRVDLASLDGASAATINRLVAACRPIAPEIVVEGIETPEVDAIVRALNPAVWAQGYSIARPMSFQDALVVAHGGIRES